MAHDVFICHSSKDKIIADAVCATLEARKVRCWISPRDVVPGTDYASSIVDAIASSTLVVMIFSSHSNRSGHVGREVERAVSHGIPILPFRVEAVEPSAALEYYISVAHWLDAFTPPLEQHLAHLAGTVRMLLDRASDAPPQVAVPEVETAVTEPAHVEPELTHAVVEPVAGAVATAVDPGDTATVAAPATPDWPTHWADSRPQPAMASLPVASPPAARRPRKRLVVAAAVIALAAGALALATTRGGGCDLEPGGDLASCDLSGRELSGRDLRDADLRDADLTGAVLHEVNLAGADLRGAALAGADLSGADLREASMGGADLSGADLSDADLSGARLREVDLRAATLERSVFAGAELDRAELSGLDLSTVDLRDADLAEAHLDGATLTGTALDGAGLAGADLSGADLTGASAVVADFEGATMDGTILALLDLSGATGVTDEQLIAALGVPADRLAAEATEREIRFDSFEAILAATAPVRDGTAVEAAGAYVESDAFHPAVLLGPGPDTTTPGWASGVQEAWAPTGLRFAELVVVARAETWEVIQVCEYTSGGVSAPPITRYQATTTVQILAASDGRVVAEQTFLGTIPRACGANEPFDLEELRGERPDLAGEAVPWVQGFVHPPG